jgi:hypothetical protein
MDLPLWLVQPLQERHIVSAQLPTAYSERCVSEGPHVNGSGASAGFGFNARCTCSAWSAVAQGSRAGRPSNCTTPEPLRPCHDRRNRRRADAGASCVNLKGVPYFYRVGLQCSGM